MKTAATVSPAQSEIATVAYQLWLDNGCPVGSDQEHWFRAEAILKNALATEFEIVAEFRWEGHWEVWEREWGGAQWIWE